MIDFNKWGNPEEETKEVDFAAVKAQVNGYILPILEHYQPGGKVVNGEYVCGTKYGGTGSSCSTNTRTGVGSDFGSGETWGDIIDLIAQVEDVSMSESARRLQAFVTGSPGLPRSLPVIPQQTPEERYETGKKIALALWMEADHCPAHHPYLVKKQITPDSGIKYHRATGNILIPLLDEYGTTWSVQRIDSEGGKRINHCGKLAGNFYVIAGATDTVYICEGYATAQTVATATGKTAVVAVSAGNLAAVAPKVSKIYPTSRLIFAADNDNDKDINPGIKTATEAVKLIGRGRVIAPPAGPGQKVDWNDYIIQYGATAGRALLLKDSKPLFVDVLELAEVETDFLIDGVIETPCTGMIFGASGCGKSFFAIDLALHVALNKRWLGREVKGGPVIYVCGEGRHGIPRRVKAWEKHHNVKLPHGRLNISNLRLSMDAETVEEMIRNINELSERIGKPAMVIIDTMARALPDGADENSAKDVNLFLNGCDKLQQLYNCSVIIVHHSGHGETKRARGSSAIKGALDVEILLCNNLIEWTKTKDMEPPSPIKYELKQVVYGDGKRDNSCVMEYDLSAKPVRGTGYSRAAREAFHEAIEAEGMGDRCLIDTWVSCMQERFPDKSAKALKMALVRKDGGEIARLITAGEVKMDGKFYVRAVQEDDVIRGMFEGG